MLESRFITKGPSNTYTIPKGWSMGEYIINTLKKRNPEDIFSVDGVTNQTQTNGQLVSEALKLADILRKLGVQIGDIVAIVSENNIKFPVVLIATLYVGAAINPLNPSYSTGELKHAFSMSKPKVVFCSKAAMKNVNAIKTEVDSITKLILIETLDDSQATDLDILEDMLRDTVVDIHNVEPAVFDGTVHTAMILLSSGTTGLPKGVMLTHENIRHPVGYGSDTNIVGIHADDVTIGVLPFFHILGLSTVIFAAVYGIKLIVLPSFQPAEFLKSIQIHKATIVNVVPPIVSFLAKHPVVKNFNISSLRMILCSGGSLGKEIQEEFHKVQPNTSILLAYGITETTGACTIFTSKDVDKNGSVGRLVPDTEGMVWSSSLGKNLGPLETGELCFKSPAVMKGYIGREANEVDEYGFYHTGDVGYYNEDGYFFIEGRIKELIKYKGFQVAPAELEDLLLKNPAIKDCGVIGIPDERAGQLPTALVVLQSDSTTTAEEIVNYVAERISMQKHLHGGVYFVDSIPRNAAGKILRDKLMEMYKTKHT